MKEEAVSVESPTLSKSQKKRERKKLKKRAKQALLKQYDEEALLKLKQPPSNLALFAQPPPEHRDCPICFLRIPTLESGYRYKSCCGKVKTLHFFPACKHLAENRNLRQ